MKIQTEITTRNWNNGWVDVNVRMPKDGDSCYILYIATLIDYDPKTLKSTYVEKIKNMGCADYENGTWTDVHADYGCDRCWNQKAHDFLKEYYYYPMNNSTPCYGRGSDEKIIITEPVCEIVDSDVFKLNPNRLYCLSKTLYETTKKNGTRQKRDMKSVDFEILAWCTIPDEPINPFEKGEVKNEKS